MPTNVGITARAITKDYDGPDFSPTEEQLKTADFLVKSNLPAYFISPDGTRVEVDLEKFEAFKNGRLNSSSTNSPQNSQAGAPQGAEDERSKQVAHLVDEGMSPEEAAEKTKPGSAGERAKSSSGIKTDSVLIRQAEKARGDFEKASAAVKEESQALKEAMKNVSEAVAASPDHFSLRRDPDKVIAGFAGGVLRNITGRGTESSSPIAAVSSPSVTSVPEVASPDIGVQSPAEIGRTSGSVSGEEAATPLSPPLQADSFVARGRPEGSTGPDANLSSSVSPTNPPKASLKDRSPEKGILGAAGGVAGGVKGIKNGLAGKTIGLKSGIGGLPGKVITTAKTLAGALAGNPLDMLKSAKMLWDNKGRILKYGLAFGGGLVAAPLLALYAAIAPWLAAVSPAALIGAGVGGTLGFFVGGPIGMVAGAGIGVAVATNWAAITAGVQTALASIAGIGGAIGGAVGGFGAALAAPAFGIGAITLGVGLFGFIPGGPKDQSELLLVFGNDSFKTSGIVVEKIADRSQIENNPVNEPIVYTVKIANTTSEDMEITIDDKVMSYQNSRGTFTDLGPMIPAGELPTTLSKGNNRDNPLVVKYTPLVISGAKFNDSVITNTVTVTAKSADGQEITETASAQVVVGGQDDHPFGFPVGGILSSVDEDPCGDHWGGFFGIPVADVYGIDIVGGANAPVVSTLTGKIIGAGFRNTGTDERNDVGGYVYIQSLDGNFVVGYQHLNRPDESKIGTIINRGDEVGTIYPDKLPTTSGSHLHYQIIQRINGNWQNVSFSDPSRAGACLADPVDSPEANVIPYVLTKPSFVPSSCSTAKLQYTPTGPVAQDVVCK